MKSERNKRNSYLTFYQFGNIHSYYKGSKLKYNRIYMDVGLSLQKVFVDTVLRGEFCRATKFLASD